MKCSGYYFVRKLDLLFIKIGLRRCRAKPLQPYSQRSHVDHGVGDITGYVIASRDNESTPVIFSSERRKEDNGQKKFFMRIFFRLDQVNPNE